VGVGRSEDQIRSEAPFEVAVAVSMACWPAHGHHTRTPNVPALPAGWRSKLAMLPHSGGGGPPLLSLLRLLPPLCSLLRLPPLWSASPSISARLASGAGEVSCADELADLCGVARRQAEGGCLVCAGQHQAQLRRAGCSVAALDAWCAAPAIDPPAVMWAKGYTFGQAESHPHAGVECQDGGYLVVGDGQDYADLTVRRQIMVLKTDRDGNVQWQQTFGDTAWNYGKFGIQLADGNFLIAGAMSRMQEGTHGRVVLQRTLLRLDSITGALLEQLSLPNTGWTENRRDGFMCVAPDDLDMVIATGFVGGENSTVGGSDEPMFLIGGGSAFAMKISLRPKLAVAFEMALDAGASDAFQVQQGMRIFRDEQHDAYIVSHTVRFDGSDDFQFGLTSISTDGTMNWVKAFPAEAGTELHGHASHPYALTQGQDGSYAIGGLASIYSQQWNTEVAQGRLLATDANGEVLFDQRFTSAERDTNIECVAATRKQVSFVFCGVVQL
jgi:hypothetical protein